MNLETMQALMSDTEKDSLVTLTEELQSVRYITM